MSDDREEKLKKLTEIIHNTTDAVFKTTMEEYKDVLSEYQIAVLTGSIMEDLLSAADIDHDWTVTLTPIDEEDNDDESS